MRALILVLVVMVTSTNVLADGLRIRTGLAITKEKATIGVNSPYENSSREAQQDSSTNGYLGIGYQYQPQDPALFYETNLSMTSTRNDNVAVLEANIGANLTDKFSAKIGLNGAYISKIDVDKTKNSVGLGYQLGMEYKLVDGLSLEAAIRETNASCGNSFATDKGNGTLNLSLQQRTVLVGLVYSFGSN
jgi:opacity protein-like surface antigen